MPWAEAPRCTRHPPTSAAAGSAPPAPFPALPGRSRHPRRPCPETAVGTAGERGWKGFHWRFLGEKWDLLWIFDGFLECFLGEIILDFFCLTV